MKRQPAILITGTGSNSLGIEVFSALRDQYAGVPIVALDRRNSPSLANVQNAVAFDMDLNPLADEAGYEHFVDGLHRRIEDARQQLGFVGIGIVILGAGVYEFGDIVGTPVKSRKTLVGVNVCGKIEVIHAVMEFNARIGFNNAENLILVEIGSLHGLAASGGRPLYAATKAFGLDFCLSLLRGHEIKRLIHIAPGPMDTHMLHRNHWVSKEQGSSEFFQHVIDHHPDRYSDLFVHCDEHAFTDVATDFSEDTAQLLEVFIRYKKRRERQLAEELGILRPADVASVVVENLRITDGEPGIVCTIMARGGNPHVELLPVDQVIRREYQ